MLKYVIATVHFEATHHWPGVLESGIPGIEEVGFLRHPHRHVFHIKARRQVWHNDREVEIIVLKHQIKSQLKEWYPAGDMGATSCETLAERLVEAFGLASCEVLEDGENGAFVIR